MNDDNGPTAASESIGGSHPLPPENESGSSRELYEFGPFRLEPSERKLVRGNVTVALTPKAFDTLHLLVRNSGHLLGKDELMRMLWPDTFVEEGSLANNIFLLRKALGDSPEYIETVPRRGYRFVGSVRRLPDGLSPPSEASKERQSGIADTASNRRLSDQANSPILSRVKILALIVAIVLAFGVRGWRVFRDHKLALGNAAHIRSLAVLPLANLSGDPEQEYFSDGLTEELTTDLSKFSALRVISRTSMTHYKGTQKTVPEIARDLNVDAVIEGTVLRSGDHLRITVNLIQASPEKHLWAENYETETRDILRVQARVAQSVAREIQTSLRPPEQQPLSSHTVNPAVQDLYFRGLHAFDSETAEAAQTATGYFQEAIQKDSTYAPAYAGLALVQAMWYPGEPGPRQKMPKARAAAQKALVLDETLSRAHRAMGYIELCYDWNWVNAEREFKRALDLDPNDSHTHAQYARELVILGRTDEAMTHVRQAVILDPYSPEDYPLWVTYLARRYDDALQLAKAKIALNPNYPWNHYELALVYEQMGKSTESVQEYLKFETLAGADPKTIARLQEAFDKSGIRGFWRQRLDGYQEAAKSGYVSAGMVAGICVRAGERDSAFEWLEKAFGERDDLMINLNVDPVFDGIRTDPRFRDLVRRVGLPQ